MKLEVKNLNKSFNKTHILKDVSFVVESGKAMGFLGRNGAGKTTTIRILMDVFKGDSGEVLIDGKPINRKDYKIGYLPEERGMYQKVSLLEQLIYFGELKGMNKSDARESAFKWLKTMELDSYANKKLETLSKGNQQKVQILQAVINDPDIVIFDEPFSGLDPVNSLALHGIIREFIEKDRIVIFSSHQMGHVEQFCDDVTFIKKGQIIESGNLERLKIEKGRGRFSLLTNTDSALDKISKLEKVVSLEESGKNILIEVEEGYTSNELLKDIIDSNVSVVRFEPFTPNLEEIFIELDKEALV